MWTRIVYYARRSFVWSGGAAAIAWMLWSQPWILPLAWVVIWLGCILVNLICDREFPGTEPEELANVEPQRKKAA